MILNPKHHKWVILAAVVVTWMSIPTGTPDDLLMMWVVSKVGYTNYLIYLVSLVAFLLFLHIRFNTFEKMGKAIFK